ncbi:TldD/PmbA family protein [Methanogenium organophilum]|uniref:TldD/PmbA family protein n=1 Tax=Methanogenium organophilum TaxID=2199 RepID=A0A9X9S6B4_METOG|nr:TldD/PmbA family protein [Methanogenium organophilum]WAI02257.1 TldD/PmbA family protein [Methanogenium organophilum]
MATEEPRYYDVRHLVGTSTHIDIENGTIEAAGQSFADSAIVRALGSAGWGMVVIDNFSDAGESGMKQAVADALSLSRATGERVELAQVQTGLLPVPGVKEDPREVSLEEKTELLASIESAARIPGIVNTRARYIESEGTVRFMDSSGNEFGYEMVRSGYSILAVAGRGGEMQMARESEHAITGLNMRHREEKGREAAVRALLLLDAEPARGGMMNAILDPELAGVFAHEAIGHASEGDLVKEGVSVLKGMTGQQIASPVVTVVDDPTLPEFGFMPVDAEGSAVQRTEIIRNGILTNYLHSRETLAAVGDGVAGHARAEGSSSPIVRMSNTFIENGDATMDELLEGCKTGILLKGSRGGQVDPGRGVFQFNAEYGYVIEDGEQRGMVRDVSLSGDILTTMHNIALCGTDRKMTPGYCGKGGQSVPVTDGSPHLLLKSAVVGGRNA